MSKLNVLSYNLWFHKAFDELPAMVREYDVDVLCLQEYKVAELTQTIDTLSLARIDFLDMGIGLATYVNTERWLVLEAAQHSLPSAAYEKISGKKDRTRLQLFRLIDISRKQQVVVGNVHIANLLSSNRIRRRQSEAAAKIILDFAANAPALLVGDFNYPFAQRGLVYAMNQVGLDCVSGESSAPTYQKWPRRTFDRMFASNMTAEDFVVLPGGASDHSPIFGNFTIY